MTIVMRRDVDEQLRALVQTLKQEIGRLQLDARRLAARGNATFAGEIIVLSTRLDAVRRQTEQFLGPST